MYVLCVCVISQCNQKKSEEVKKKTKSSSPFPRMWFFRVLVD